ncbi:hypothetical protein UM590_03670 [Staphylococcus aureus]|nr:hypothetical protein UM590_03670 [Staphylococcus aureus]
MAPLQAAKTQLQNDIDQPTSTTGMTSASVAAFNDKLSAARTKIQEIDRVLAFASRCCNNSTKRDSSECY